MLHVLVGLLVLLLSVCVARLLFLPRSWLTFGLLSIAFGFVFYFPEVDRAMDHAVVDSIGVANVSDLGHILLTLAAWWTLGLMSLMVLRRESPLDTWLQRQLSRHSRTRRLLRALHGNRPQAIAALWLWTVANVITGIAVLTVWAVSDMSHTEVNDMLDLHDAGTRALLVMYGGWAFLGGVLVVTAAAIGLRTPGAPRPALWVMLCIGLCGIGYAASASAVIAVGGTDTLQDHAVGVMALWAIPGLALLAVSGAAGLVAEAQRRLSRA